MIRVARHSNRRSRGLVFLALAIYLLPVVVAGDALIETKLIE